MGDPKTLEDKRNSDMSGILLGVTELPASPESVNKARTFVRTRLGADHPALEDVKLLTSEVFTNSVMHSDSRHGGSVMVALVECWDRIHVDVVDAGGNSFPRVQADIPSEGGRGLMLVDLISDQWGVYEDSAGRTVWFQVTYSRVRTDSRESPIQATARRAACTVAQSLSVERGERAPAPDARNGPGME
ncbi:ATP-binding protein [Sphaerisporangium sp. NPDC051017]|uniref:ATP-binding protein n=1 Tax=Sphaerisporangium sp. NPDC051017 TaxID=3154636 RepID=UPI0034472181